MIEYLLKRRSGLGAILLAQVSQSPHISGPELGRRLIQADRFQRVNRSIRRLIRPMTWRVAFDLNRGSDCRQPHSVNGGVFWEAPSQAIGERLRLSRFAAQGERDRRA